MKKILLIAGALLALAACTKEPVVETQAPKDGPAYLTFKSEKPQFDATKTAWNGNTIVWADGDKIKVGFTFGGNWWGQTAAYGAQSESPNNHKKFYQSNEVSIDAKDASVGTFSVPTDFTGDESNGEYVFYALYPATAMADNNQDSAPNVKVNLKTTQTPVADSFDGSADIMVGKSASINSTGLPTDPIDLTWTRVVAHGYLTFQDFREVEEDETITKVVLSATTEQGSFLAGNVQVNLTDGDYSVNTGSNELTLIGTNLSFVNETVANVLMTSMTAWVCLLPENITGLDVDVETNKAHYTKSFTGFSRTFKQNAKNNLAINMSTATRTPKTGQLVPDGYYVISYGDYMMTVGTESNAYRGSATKNVIDPSDDAIWKINYVQASDAYTIHSLSANKDLYGITNDNADLRFASGSNLTNLFTIDNSEASTYKIAPLGNGGVRAIGYNVSSPRFALYKGLAQQPVTLNLTSVTVSETPVITIAEEERSKTVLASATSVSFTYVPNMFAIEVPTVTVASDEDHIIDGNPSVENGTITVGLNTNADAKNKVATLTVSGTGISSPITLTINQEPMAYSYLFTSKSWAATRDGNEENWLSGSDGASFTNGGIQVTTKVSGATGSSPYSFTNISKVVVTYCTNASDGAGSISVKVGNGTAKSSNVTNTGGTTARTLVYTFNPAESGIVTITVNCTKNSIYLIGADITAASIVYPTAYSITCTTGLANGSIEANKDTAYAGDEITLTATPAEGYQLGEWTVTEATSGAAVTVTNGKFTMPSDNVNVSATFEIIGDDPILELDLTTKSYGTSNYNTSTTYDNWTIVNGANNNKGWTYFKMGGKNTTIADNNPCYIYSNVGTTIAASTVTVHLPAGSLSKSGMSVNSWGVYVYSDQNRTQQIDYIAGGTITNGEGEFTFTPTSGQTWPSGSFFMVSWDLANTTTTNGIVCVDKITIN